MSPLEKIQLNDKQLEAVTFGEGPLLVVAGAGTGKTTVITERIKWLIGQNKANPSEMLALTFTEKAAQEMEERVDVALPMGYVQTWISTFHSFCEQVLRNEAIHIGLDPDFRILSEAETYLFVRSHLSEFVLDYFRPLGNPTKFISGLITHFNRLRDEDVTGEEYQNWVKSKSRRLSSSKKKSSRQNSHDHEENAYLVEDEPRWHELANAYQIYEKLKVQNSVMDFADLISQTLHLFRERPNILRKYQQQFKYILVDEFQDTNYAQNELAMLLAGDDRNITVVFDDDQAIYRWRGAAVYNVMGFKLRFPEAKIVTLIRNYRSFQNILDWAYDFIQKNNPDRLEVKEGVNKKLMAVRGETSNKIGVIREERVENEAERVVEEIMHLRGEEKNTPYDFRDFAILVRANRYADPFVQALSRSGIPYQFLGPGQLYHQPEIKDLIAYLKILHNFEDNVAFYRVLNISIFDFNPRDLAALVNYSRKNNLSLFEVFEKAGAEEPEVKNLQSETYKKVQSLMKMINRHLALVPKETPGQILFYFLQDSGLLRRFSDPKSSFEQRQIQNISKFFDKLKSFETQNPEAKVGDFVEYLDFVISQGESPLASQIDWTQEDAVNILTFHSAKGLEFPVVFMANLVDLRFPTRGRSEQIPLPEELIKESLPSEDPHIQEERRLFYVGMTRARDLLYFTGAKFYGENKKPKRLSPFVFETLGKEIEPFILKTEKERTLTLFEWRDKRADSERVEDTEKKGPLAQQPSTLMPTRVDFLSFSQMNTYEICPLQYRYKYILRIPVPQSAAASFGNAMHNALRDFYKNLKEGVEQELEDLLQLLEKHWSSEGYESKELEKERFKRGQNALSHFFQNFHDPKNLPIQVEHNFKVRVGDLRVGGYIDRIDQLSEGKVEITDYKTGQVYDQKKMDNDEQLSIYALAVQQPVVLGKPLEEQKLSFYFFETGEKKSTQRKVAQIDKVKKKVIEVAEEINQGKFEPKVSQMCEYCEYRLLCPAYRGKI